MRNDQVFLGLKVEPSFKAEAKAVAERFFDGNLSNFVREAIEERISWYEGIAFYQDDPEAFKREHCVEEGDE